MKVSQKQIIFKEIFIVTLRLICSLSGILSFLMQKLSKSIVQFRNQVELSFLVLWLQDSLGYLTTLPMTFIIPFCHVQWGPSQTRHLKERKDARRVLQVTVTLRFNLHACLELVFRVS